jgi:hypothetical protein
MIIDQDYEVIVVVTQTGSVIIASYPEEIQEYVIDESEWLSRDEDSRPSKPGVYCCKVRYWFQQGYYEGHPSEGESSFGLEIIESVMIVGFPLEASRDHENSS